METVEVIKKFGGKDVYVGCTHGVLSGPAIERIAKSDLKELVTTNTIPLPEEKQLDKIVVVSISGQEDLLSLQIYHISIPSVERYRCV